MDESKRQVRFAENGSVSVEVSCLGTAQKQDKDITRVASTPKKQKVISPSSRGEGLWRVPFLI